MKKEKKLEKTITQDLGDEVRILMTESEEEVKVKEIDWHAKKKEPAPTKRMPVEETLEKLNEIQEKKEKEAAKKQESKPKPVENPIVKPAEAPEAEEAPQGKSRLLFVLKIIAAVLILAIAAAYAGGRYYYNDRFLQGTVIDKMNVSGMTIEELEQKVPEYMLKIIERKADGSTLEEDIQGHKIAMKYASSEPLKEILNNQNKWMWFQPQERVYVMEDLLTFDDKLLGEEVKKLKGFDENFYTAPQDAFITEYEEGVGFSIYPEVVGNQLNYQRTFAAVDLAIRSLDEVVDLDACGCYEQPKILSGNPTLQETLSNLKEYENIRITYRFGDNEEVLDGNTISKWLKLDGTEVLVDQTRVEAYVATLRKKYDSIFRPRKFVTSYDEKEITIEGGDYGWWMNYGQEAIELGDMIRSKESGSRTPVYYQTAAHYGAPDYGNTYVEVNLTAQHLFFYIDGELELESDFVSGNSSKGHDTPEGVYGITYKQRNATLVGENYSTPVSYWMPFNKNVGLHDASWRSSFGGDLYKTSGSHGCVNLPPEVAKAIYEKVEKGTPVICYNLPGTEPKKEEKKEADKKN